MAGGRRKRFGDVWKEFEWGFAIKNGFMEVALSNISVSVKRKHVQVISDRDDFKPRLNANSELKDTNFEKHFWVIRFVVTIVESHFKDD